MDSLTHILVGAVIAQAVSAPKLGRKAYAFAALAATLPDFDVLFTPYMGEFGDWKYHRALTHSLWFGPIVGSLMGWGLWKYYGEKATHLWAWIATMVIAMFAHPILDACTIYGTQLLSPFSNERFEVSAVSIIDPVYSVVLLFALCLPFHHTLFHYRFQIGIAAIIFAIIYPLYGLHQNNLSKEFALKQLDTEKIPHERLTAYTTLFQPYLRRIVVRDNPDQLRVGFLTTFKPDTITWSCQTQAPKPIRDAVLATEAGSVFQWFAGDELNITVDQEQKHVSVTDARYGMPGPSIFGWWGLSFAVKQDAQGNWSATPTGRIQTGGDVSLPAIKGLMRAAYGLPNDLLPTTSKGC